MAVVPNQEYMEYGEISNGELGMESTGRSGDIEGSEYQFLAVRI